MQRVVSTSHFSDRFELVTLGVAEKDSLVMVYFFPLNVFSFHVSGLVLLVKLLSIAQHHGHLCKSEAHSLVHRGFDVWSFSLLYLFKVYKI